MQSSPAPARRGRSLGGGWAGQNPAPTLQPDTECPGAGPSRASGSAREPVAGKGSKSYDSLSGQLGARCPGILSPSQPFKAKLRWALPASLQNGPTVGCMCARPRAGAQRTDTPPPTQVSIWSPAGGCPAPCQSLRPRPPRSLSPALCKSAPDTHNLQDSCGPQGALPHLPSG